MARIRLTCLAIVLLAVASASREAFAQDVVVERREVPVGAGVPWIGAGTIILSLSTGASLVVATSSSYDKDRLLFIPIVGPWIDLAYRPPASSEENWARVGLVVDGIAQAAGLAMLIVGTVMHHTRLPKHPRELIVPIATSGGAGVSFTFQ